MNIVIQCAGSKRTDAGQMRRRDGTPVMLVAQPAYAPGSQHLYARPDDLADDGKSWRETLLDYNRSTNKNPWGLLRSADLYRPHAYAELVSHFGIEKIFILSAGWGLVRGDFRLPDYDITFSAQAEKYKRRTRAARWGDFNQLPINLTGPTVFLGGKDYLPLFTLLSRDVPGRRVVFYNSQAVPAADGCELRHYSTTMRTNWHYRCVRELVNVPFDSVGLLTGIEPGNVGDTLR